MTQENIANSVTAISRDSPILQTLIKTGQIGLLGALYDVHTGHVQFDQGFFR